MATRSARIRSHGASGERKVSRVLNNSSKPSEHKQINNLIILDTNGKSHQIDQIEIRNNGIFCIETKSFVGWVFGNDTSEQWTETVSTGKKYKVYNPVKQNKSHCFYLSKILKNKYKVNSLIVLANNNAGKIESAHVVNLRDLSNYLKYFNDGTYLSSQEINKIYNEFMSYSSGLSNAEHIQNVRKTRSEISKNICPRCGGKLVLRKGPTGEFYGCSNYPECKFTKNK